MVSIFKNKLNKEPVLFAFNAWSGCLRANIESRADLVVLFPSAKYFSYFCVAFQSKQVHNFINIYRLAWQSWYYNIMEFYCLLLGFEVVSWGFWSANAQTHPIPAPHSTVLPARHVLAQSMFWASSPKTHTAPPPPISQSQGFSKQLQAQRLKLCLSTVSGTSSHHT